MYQHSPFVARVAALSVALVFWHNNGAAQTAAEDYTNGMGIPYMGDGLGSWVDGKPWNDWKAEREKREKREQSVRRYLYERDPDLSPAWGLRQKGSSQSSYVDWKWFEEAPVGFGGVPLVVLKTILDLDRSQLQIRRL